MVAGATLPAPPPTPHTNTIIDIDQVTHTHSGIHSMPFNSQAARVALFSRSLPPPPVNERWKVARSSHSMLFPSRFIYRLIVGGPARAAADFTAFLREALTRNTSSP